jgi:hypothetical protein
MPGAIAPPSKAAVGGDDVEGCGGAGVDDDQVTRIDQMRPDGVDQPVRARLADGLLIRTGMPRSTLSPMTSGSTADSVAPGFAG